MTRRGRYPAESRERAVRMVLELSRHRMRSVTAQAHAATARLSRGRFEGPCAPLRHTFATWAIAHDARELDVQYLLGHSWPNMVRRYSSSYRSEQAALRHHRFSPADQMIVT